MAKSTGKLRVGERGCLKIHSREILYTTTLQNKSLEMVSRVTRPFKKVNSNLLYTTTVKEKPQSD